MWPPRWPPLHSVNTGVKKETWFPRKFPWFESLMDCLTWYFYMKSIPYTHCGSNLNITQRFRDSNWSCSLCSDANPFETHSPSVGDIPLRGLWIYNPFHNCLVLLHALTLLTAYRGKIRSFTKTIVSQSSVCISFCMYAHHAGFCVFKILKWTARI